MAVNPAWRLLATCLSLTEILRGVNEALLAFVSLLSRHFSSAALLTRGPDEERF